MYIFDFENTLTNYDWRLELLPDKEKIKGKTKKEKEIMWLKFHEKMFMDKPKPENCQLYKLCCLTDITYILTACDDVLDHRQQIELWLTNYSLPMPRKIIMRPKGNIQTSPEFKANICLNLKISFPNIFVFDDRNDVIEKMYSIGIPGIILS